MVKTWESMITDWRSTNGLGADFKVYVDQFAALVRQLDSMCDNENASAESLNSFASQINAKGQNLFTLAEARKAPGQALITFGAIAAPIVKESCGVLISALATPLAAAGYASLMSVIDSAINGDSFGIGTLKAVLAGVLESGEIAKAGKDASELSKLFKGTLNQAFQNVGSAVSDYVFAIKGKDLSRAEKEEMAKKLKARIAFSIAMSPIAGAIKTIPEEHKLEEQISEVMSEVFDKVVELTLKPE
jgi:hypothetical protein